MVDLARRRLFNRGVKQHANTQAPQRMPWLVGESEFIADCSRCNKCINVCETSIIVKGDGGFPEVDFSLGECSFCEKCADICPEPLFTPRSEPSIPRSELAWQQVARINDKCLSLQGVECRICGENCEYSAIKFRLQVGGRAKPILNEIDCTGCGGCIKPCPANAIDIYRPSDSID
ncbi:ferredoxin-type protein NapF [Vibrio sp. TH_r3]|uniref:ferredoxin-type protein NapF n=1 Tax=Vibrio sp. TH_r3 TaxID=3082084 RepID=UPI002954967D|nr:ferredoxin-type protein NapF [Vibrio sp. TH_r3]MDV7104823.1 ferredoxin-type protein NapF [Vibrio sp. TH_r3]